MMTTRLTPSEQRLFRILLDRSRSGGSVTPIVAGMRPVTLRVMITRLRNKLEPFGIRIVNTRGAGWTIPRSSMDRIRKLEQ